MRMLPNLQIPSHRTSRTPTEVSPATRALCLIWLRFRQKRQLPATALARANPMPPHSCCRPSPRSRHLQQKRQPSIRDGHHVHSAQMRLNSGIGACPPCPLMSENVRTRRRERASASGAAEVGAGGSPACPFCVRCCPPGIQPWAERLAVQPTALLRGPPYPLCPSW